MYGSCTLPFGSNGTDDESSIFDADYTSKFMNSLDCDILLHDDYEDNFESAYQSNHSKAEHLVCDTDFDEQIEKKVVRNDANLFCYICNYGFKSFPRLIRHMETKKHANQVEKCRGQEFYNYQISLPQAGILRGPIQNIHNFSSNDTLELVPANVINEIIVSLGEDLRRKENFFNDIELNELDDIPDIAEML